MKDIQIIGADQRTQQAWLFDHIRESREAKRQVVLYVPEQYTLQAERDLMMGMSLPGLLNLDVISPTKLKALIRERAGYSGRRALDEAGRAMAIHQALQDCAEDLVYYQRLGSLYGAVPRMDTTLSEMREENLTPEALEELAEGARSGARKAKYQDLSKIWRSYDALLQGRFDDPADAWRDTCGRLGESGLWQGVDLYVYGFDTVRPDLRELVMAAAKVCHEVRVLLNMRKSTVPMGRIYRPQRESAARLSAALEEQGSACEIVFLESAATAPENAMDFLSRHLFSQAEAAFAGDPSPTIRLYAAPHPTGEALAITGALAQWHREGIPWNRMAIALPKPLSEFSPLMAALRRHGIPYFASRGEEMARHGVCILLSSALVCVSQGNTTEPLLEMARAGFGTLTREEGARLTEYVQAWGIDRGRWKKPFTRGDDAEEAEELRLRLLRPVDHLHDALRDAANAEESVAALLRFLQEEGIYAQLQARQERLMAQERYAEAIVDRQVWQRMLEMLDQLHALLGGRRATLKETAMLMIGALERATLSALPEEQEGVLVGRIGHMLPGRTEALILPGMNEGIFSAKNDSLLSDTERRTLQERTGKAIGMDTAQMGMIIRSDYVRTMTLPEKRLWVSYCLRDEAGSALLPGEPVTELRRLFPGLREEGGLARGEMPPVPELPSLALEELGGLLREVRIGERADLPVPWQEALRNLLRREDTAGTAQGMLRSLREENPERRIPPSVALRLFHGSHVSISRLECYAACPRQHFLRYGLKPRLPGSFEFTPGDAGNFFHAALQQYLDQAVAEPEWPRLSDERVDQIMAAILEQLTLPWEEGPLRENAAGEWQGEEYLRRARHAAAILTRFAANSDFQPLGTEIEFGAAGGMKPLMLRLEDGGRVSLQGKIDRLDLYRGPEGDYLRILDLKSSEKRLEPARMDSGEQLQLMIYLKAALRDHPGMLPAGALYFPIQDREVKAESPDAAEAERMKNVQLRGVTLAEEDVIRAMDRDQSPYSLPKVFNVDGSVSKSADWALTREIMQSLMDAAERKAAELCLRIRSGEMPIAPSVSEDRSPCTWCEFVSICPVRKVDERPLPKGMKFADVG